MAKKKGKAVYHQKDVNALFDIKPALESGKIVFLEDERLKDKAVQWFGQWGVKLEALPVKGGFDLKRKV